MKRIVFLAFTACFLLTGAALAEVKVLKHDQFNEDLFVAVAEVNGMSLSAQPAFAQGEAFGQIHKFSPGELPVKILGLQLIMAAPPNNPDMKTHLGIEFWYDDSDGPIPSGDNPDWAIDTTDLYDPNTGATGVPIQGGVGTQIDFDWTSQENHPPLMTSGNLWIMMRFIMPSQDLQTEWDTLQCAKVAGLACGCQKAALLLDQSVTPGGSILNYFTSGCEGGMTWNFFESIGLTGDPILRVKVETAGECFPDCSGKQCGDDGCDGSCGTCGEGQSCKFGVCVGDCIPDCTNKECGNNGCGESCGTCSEGKVCQAFQCVECTPECAGKECGDDGCGGSCGLCEAGEVCDSGQCVTKADGVKVEQISPDFGYSDVETPVTITGHGFVPGLTAKLGGTTLGSVQVTGDSIISAVVPADMEAGSYMLVVINSDESSGFLEDAFEVRERGTVIPDDGPSCGDDCTEPGSTGGDCSAGSTSTPFALVLLVASLAVFLVLRRRAGVKA